MKDTFWSHLGSFLIVLPFLPFAVCFLQQNDDDGDAAAAAADFANLDVFPEADEQWLERIQTGQANDDDNDDSHSERPCEPAESEKVQFTEMFAYFLLHFLCMILKK